jgi:hypothetical protein
MNRKFRFWQPFLIILVLSAMGLSSCTRATASYPRAWIDYPSDGASLPVGISVNIFSHVYAQSGVAEVVLSVNGEPYRRDVPDEAGGNFVSMQQAWLPEEAGTFTLQVLGYDLEGEPGHPATISVEVVEEDQEVLPEPIITEPAITEPPSPSSASIEFYSDPPEIEAGSCATIYWNVENAQQVIFGGVDQSFNGSFETCLCKNERYTLKVIHLDGTEERRTVDISVTGSCEEEPPPESSVDNSPPPVPSPSVPASGAELSCRSSQNLAWIPVDDPSGISGYYVKLEQQVTKGQWQSAGGYGPVSGKQVSVNVDCGGIYRWMVRAQDGAGNDSGWSAPATFSISLN